MEPSSLIQTGRLVASHRVIVISREAYPTATQRKRPPRLSVLQSKKEETFPMTRYAGHQAAQSITSDLRHQPQIVHKSLTKMRLGHGDHMVETAIAPADSSSARFGGTVVLRTT